MVEVKEKALLREIYIAAPALLMILAAVLATLEQFSGDRIDWDIDHMLYFGGRLVAGDFHWTVEFDDKLPVNQFLFALPGATRSMNTWLAISLFSIMLGCWAGGALLVRILGDGFQNLNYRFGRRVAFYAASLMFCLYALLPGGIGHVNPIAASMVLVAINFLDLAQRQFDSRNRLWVWTFLFGAFAASVAVGVRPYFLPPLVFAGIWSALRLRMAQTSTKCRWTSRTSWAVGWCVCIGIFGVLVNVVPYLALGEMDKLVGGLGMLSQETNPQTLAENLETQLYVLFVQTPTMFRISALASAGWVALLAVLSFRNQHEVSRQKVLFLDAAFLCLLAPATVLMMFLQRHFWPHYFQMFVPFFGLSLGFLAALFSTWGVFNLTRHQTKSLVFCGCVVVVAANLPSMYTSILMLRRGASGQLEATTLAAEIKDYLAEVPERQRSFLAPGHMALHWRLGEPRHGFPHAANTLQISKGWFRNVKVPVAFTFPTSVEGYCEMLLEMGPTTVFLGAGPSWSFIVSCLNDDRQKFYRPITVPELLNGHEMMVFRRQ